MCVSKKGHEILEDCDLTIDYISVLFKRKDVKKFQPVQIMFPIKELQKRYSVAVFENTEYVIIQCYNTQRYQPIFKKKERWEEREVKHFMYINKTNNGRVIGG
jgi:hypothetical protein